MHYLIFSLTLTTMVFSSEGKIHDTTYYLNDVLNIIYPLSIKLSNLEVYNMTDFYKDILHEYRDGAIAGGRLSYHSGSVTGFQTVQIKKCEVPSWEKDNLILNCSIIFPRITVNYSVNAQISISNTDWDTKFRETHFALRCDTLGMEARLQVLISPHYAVPLLKLLPVINDGKPIYYISGSEVPEEAININIAHRFNDMLRNIFYDVYKVHFAIALGQSRYSLTRLEL